MGEEMADTLKDEVEMKGSIVAESPLNASVSFGRFDNDLLCWDRWSSFSQNKYLEEVEKCSTPGSVAEKKAYFEAHYKKIAAKKAELAAAQEQEMVPESLTTDDLSLGNSIGNGHCTNLATEVSDFGGVTESVEADKNFAALIHNDHIQDLTLDADDADRQSLSSKGSPKHSNSEVPVSVKEENDLSRLQAQFEELDVSVKEAIVDKHENRLMGSMDQSEKTIIIDHQTRNAQVRKTENSTTKPQKKTQKTTTASKEKSFVRTRKEAVEFMSKSADTPFSKATKPASASPATVSSRVSTAKQRRSPLPRSRNPSVVESKRLNPKSLHMSIALAPKNADSASSPMIRRSLILEKMGDKEIVKRAFGQFQKNLNLPRPSGDVKPPVPHKVPANGAKQIALASITPRKDKEGEKKAAEKESFQKGQAGGRSNPAVARPVKASSVEHQKSTRMSPSSAFVLRSDERAEKRKEFAKKLEEKSKAKEAESTHLQSKSKEEKMADIKKLRRNLNFRATPMPNFFQGQQKSKTRTEKEVTNNEIRHHHLSHK